MMNRGAAEVNVIAAHAHEFFFMTHRVGGIGDADDFAAGEKRVDALSLGGHHLERQVSRQRGGMVTRS